MLLMASHSERDLCAGIDEVLAWSSIFNHHMNIDDLMRNMRINCTVSDLEKEIERTTHLRLEENLVLSDRYSYNHNFAQSQEQAKRHLEDTEYVLSILCSCPHVTGLSITGSVAAGMSEEEGDVDVLIITTPGWVWRIRALAIYLSHKHPKGRLLCPNMVMSEDELEFSESLYSAREMMQMIPIKDTGGLTALRQSNLWVNEFLPNATPKDALDVGTIRDYPWWWRIMNFFVLGSIIELWEATRRIRTLKKTSISNEAIYTKSICRGHEHSHKKRIELEYLQTLEAMK